MPEQDLERRVRKAMADHRNARPDRDPEHRRRAIAAATNAIEILTDVEFAQHVRLRTRRQGITAGLASIEVSVWINPKAEAVERFEIRSLPADAGLRLFADFLDPENPAMVAMGSRVEPEHADEERRDVVALVDMHANGFDAGTPTRRAILRVDDDTGYERTLSIMRNPDPEDAIANHTWLTGG